MSDYTLTANFSLYKPTPGADDDVWGDHLNLNADTLDELIQRYLPLSGGGMVGPLTLAGDAAASLQAVTLQQLNGAISGAPFLPLTGGTLAGPLILSGDPATALGASTRQYVDAQIASAPFLLLAGGTLTGSLTLAADPVSALGAATRQYADLRVLRSGDTMVGPLILSGDPATALGASTRQYVDAQIASTNGTTAASYVPLSQKAAALGVATLDATGKLPTAQMPAAATGTLSYKGGWNAATNTPTMASGALAGGVLQPIGNYYVVTVSGTTAAIDGVTSWVAGDWIASNGTIWQRVVNSTSPYLPLTGGTLSGALTTFGGGIITQLDLRIPDVAYGWQDAAGNFGATIDTAGGFHMPAAYVTGNPTVALGLAPKQYVDSAVAAGVAAFLPLAGGQLTGPLTVAGGVVVAQLDPRIPDVPFAWQDAAGNVGAIISATGTLFWPSLQTNALTVSNVAATTISIGADTFGAADPRIPDLAYVWRDAAGNIAAGFDKNGVFNGTVAGMVTTGYVNANAVLLAGSAMTGPLLLSGDPPAGANAQAATKGYVDQMVLSAGGSGPGTDPTFNSVNVNAGYYFGGQLLIKATAQIPGNPGVPGIPNTHVGLAINSTGAGNVLIGYQTGGGQLTGGLTLSSAENTYVGMQVGANHSGGGQQNAAFGCGALRVDPNPGNVCVFGSDAARNSTNNLRAILIGAHSGRNGNGITDSILIGHWTMYGTDGVMPPLVNTVSIGSYTLSDPNMGSASNSVFVGANVAKKGQSVPGNLLLGPNVGSATLINGTGLIYLGASGAIDAATATENHTFRLGNHATNLMRATGINTASPKFFFDWLPASTSYSDDTTAKAGGVQYGQLYRNGSAVQVCCLA